MKYFAEFEVCVSNCQMPKEQNPINDNMINPPKQQNQALLAFYVTRDSPFVHSYYKPSFCWGIIFGCTQKFGQFI